MTFNVNEFRAQIDKNLGLYKPNLFTVTLNWQPKDEGDRAAMDGMERDLIFLAENATLPGVNFNTVEIFRQGYGVLEKHVTKPTFPASTIGFMLDNNGMVMEYFHRWMQYIVSFQAGEGLVNTSTKGYMGQVGYYDDYVGTVKITLLSETGASMVTYTLYDAFPLNISDVSLGWRQNDETTQLPVTFSYRYWTSEFFEPGTRDTAGAGMNLLQLIGKIQGASEIIKGSKRPRNVTDAIQVLNNAKVLGSIFK
tara:strand:+ start:2217 stop:2972 length:756 start_codon:yes stop_codon:yes gene_type:complete